MNIQARIEINDNQGLQVNSFVTSVPYTESMTVASYASNAKAKASQIVNYELGEVKVFLKKKELQTTDVIDLELGDLYKCKIVKA
jgi:hypothetical protein